MTKCSNQTDHVDHRLDVLKLRSYAGSLGILTTADTLPKKGFYIRTLAKSSQIWQICQGVNEGLMYNQLQRTYCFSCFKRCFEGFDLCGLVPGFTWD